MMVHTLTEASELPVTRRPPDPERAEIGWECAWTVTVFFHWRGVRETMGTGEGYHTFSDFCQKRMCPLSSALTRKSLRRNRTQVTKPS